ncbi:MAG TPA: glycoside hydrolase family 32 protein [Vicinamibacteria bacterium]|nr:glycoside hydrolase family 32 protein [Vicinamibacteria bacterium]
MRLASAAVLLAALPAAAPLDHPHRPRFHFTPERNFMNDPNGLVYFEGEYHLFYQHNPFGDTWGHMSWGHAVSTDLVRWTHLPVALREEDGIMVFSGSAVVDRRNTSGLCGAPGRACLVAIYTGHREGRQTQNLAASLDRGRTWTKYAGNPVLDIGSKDFRDPRVFWHEPARRWIMAVSLAEERKIRFYASDDLKRWTHLSDFGPEGYTKGQWECPDLFELPVEGDPSRTRWVLDVDVNPGAPLGGSADQYFVGTFDGTTFRNDNPKDLVLWADHGKDFYATLSWSDLPASDPRRIWIGWMSNWQYANQDPTSPWRGMLTVPRALRLRSLPEGLRLVQEPVEELRSLRRGSYSVPAVRIAGLVPLELAGDALEIRAEFAPAAATAFGLTVRKGRDEGTRIGYDVRAGEVFVDRGRSGNVAFHPDFSGRHAAPLALEGGRVRLHVLVDRSSVEVFAGGGQAVITDRIYPSPASRSVELWAEGGAASLASFEAWPLE